MLAGDHSVDDFKASYKWLTGFMDRFECSLRSCSNLTTLAREQYVQLVVRAVDYMMYLCAKIPNIDI
jgi:hypothetical protein